MCVTESNRGERGESNLGGYYHDSLVCQAFVIIVTGHTKWSDCSLKADQSLRVSIRLWLSYNFSYKTLWELLTAPKTVPYPAVLRRACCSFVLNTVLCWPGLNDVKLRIREEVSLRQDDSVKSPQPICVKGFPQFPAIWSVIK